ncbi:MAG: nucleotide exchange factor GrpE [Candidatus Acidiferrum sp.]
MADIKTNLDQDGGRVAAEQSAEAKALTEDSAAADLEVAKLAADLDELRQALLRRQADFDNYRKRIEKERSEDSKRGTARVIESLIPVIDDFELALAAQAESPCESFRRGFELIYKRLLDSVAKIGTERIEPIGKLFDPHLHQAVDRIETTEYPHGTIVQVLHPGYLFDGRVLRPAMVRVAVTPLAG